MSINNPGENTVSGLHIINEKHVAIGSSELYSYEEVFTRLFKFIIEKDSPYPGRAFTRIILSINEIQTEKTIDSPEKFETQLADLLAGAQSSEFAPTIKFG
jgi:hypothetical protein